MDSRRLRRIAFALGVSFAAGALGQDGQGNLRSQGSVRLLVQASPLAGFRHHAAALLWPSLAVGDRLDLLREPGNPHDVRAVLVEWRGHKLGYVPRRHNAAIAWALDQGYPLQARISQLDWRASPERRLRFEVFIE